MLIITVNYSCILASNLDHQARTVREAWVDHPTRKYPKFNKVSQPNTLPLVMSQVFVPTESFLPVMGGG